MLLRRSIDRALSRAFRHAGTAVDVGATRIVSDHFRRNRQGKKAHHFDRESYRSLERFYNSKPDELFRPVRDVPISCSNSECSFAKRTELCFESPYQPLHPDYLDEFASYGASMRCHARLLQGPGSQRPVAIAIHGWLGGPYWLEERSFAAKQMIDEGFDLLLYQLPFHANRSPGQGLKGPQLFPGPSPLRANETFGQIIAELRTIRGFLQEAGYKHIGAIGMSLGAYCSALWASLDEGLDFVVPIIPLVDLAQAVLSFTSGVEKVKMTRAEGVGIHEMREVYAAHSPLARPSKVSPERTFIVAGQGDRITPPAHAEQLWEHWNKPALRWFAGGHVAQLGRSTVMTEMRSFLSQLPRA